MQIFSQNNEDSVYAWWRTVPGSALNRWALSAAEIQHYPGTARPHPDQVDYRFINGWVATGDLPCREALRAELPQLDPSLPEDTAFSEIYFGGDNPRVDFTTFSFAPTRIARFARSYLKSDTTTEARFTVETCGIVHLWLNGKKALIHQPLDRNIPHKAEVTLNLQTGINEITVYLEDLHERDTSCFFEMRLTDDTPLEAGIRTETDPARIRDVEHVLNNLRTERLFHETGQVSVTCDVTPETPVTVTLSDGQMADASATMNVLLDRLPLPAGPVEFTIHKAGDAHALFDIAGIAPGCYGLVFSVQVGEVRLEKTLGTTIMGEITHLAAPTLVARKAKARALIAEEHGQSVSRALLLLAQNGDAGEIDALMRHTLVAINRRFDCADFWILPLIWAWRNHAGTQLSVELWHDIKSAILNFRYWLDEPGNDVMWYWSENHAFCFHVAQYLAGDTFPDEIFPNSGKRGSEHRATAAARLTRWFDSTDAHGLAEWNSAAYYPIDLLGLFTLYENAPDADLKSRARGLIDRIFVMTALHSVDGMPVGTQGRVYEKELFAGPATELATVAAIAFGGTWCPGHERAAALFALSDYTPPAGIDRLHELTDAKMLTARYVQGLNDNAKLSLWKSRAAQLSSVNGHRTGDKGHQQHVAEVQFAAHPLARSWISHPGELKIWGGGRPSYWMGNGIVPRVTQTENICALAYDLTRHDNAIFFTHIFVPGEVLDEHQIEKDWLFMRAGDGYAAAWCSAGLTPVTTGLYSGSEWRGNGDKMAWLLVAGSEATHGSFAAFQDSVHAIQPSFDDDNCAVDYRDSQGWLRTDFARGLIRNGKELAFAPLSQLPHVGFDGAEPQLWT